VIAAVQQARVRAGIHQAGHDGLETRVYAVKRVLWRFRGSSGPSGRYACSLEQLVVMLAPVLGWPPAPPPGTGERARWFRARRKSVQRWLQLLQDAGLIDVSGEKDQDGYWWRTIITLSPGGGPALTREQLQAARRRMRTFRRRERARHRAAQRQYAAGKGGRKLRHLNQVLSDSARPSPTTRRTRPIGPPYGA
jgi:DNA-binding PadR family transcriptional regulator